MSTYNLERELQFVRRLLNLPDDWTASEEELMIILTQCGRNEIKTSISDRLDAYEMICDYHDRQGTKVEDGKYHPPCRD